ncbi:hypothetical protein BDZ89DRAFT_949821 [Hymenopellis radicata]|nr:hypothetical protein BDZ89DRAFT_949821 [Hymenopellis radicata]
MLRKKKKSKMHQCEICQHEFPRPSGLRTHMNSHNNIRPYGCPFPGCEKTFGVRSNAKRHLRTHGNFQSDETGRAGAENPTYRDAYNPESSYRDTPASVNPAMGSTSNPKLSAKVVLSIQHVQCGDALAASQPDEPLERVTASRSDHRVVFFGIRGGVGRL